MLTVQLTDPKTTRSGATYNTMTTVNVAVTPALTPFSDTNPRAWFLLAESRFTVGKITDDADKTSCVLEALQPAIFERIAPWLETKTLTTLKYQELKEELLSSNTPSTQTRAKQILEMVNSPTDKPSARWRRMDALQHDQEREKLDLTWELWLLSLPSRVRIQIQDSGFRDTPIPELTMKEWQDCRT